MSLKQSSAEDVDDGNPPPLPCISIRIANRGGIETVCGSDGRPKYNEHWAGVCKTGE